MRVPALVGAVTLGAVAVAAGAALARAGGVAGAPAWAHALRNPYEGRDDAVRAGGKLFERHCASCHGAGGRGGRRAPALDSDAVAGSQPGDLFWFVTNGNLRAGMPAWSRLPEARRWQIVTFLKSLHAAPEGVGKYPLTP